VFQLWGNQRIDSVGIDSSSLPFGLITGFDCRLTRLQISVSLGEISSARMRTLSTLLMVLLLCSVQQVYCGTGAVDIEDCCHKLTKLRKLPLARIESYSLTSSDCPIKAVVFQMVGGKSFCVDPSWNWVESHMKKVWMF
ncbi:hypothetical protein MHYP_G00117650, partial [Metynnis hypsauchen]